MSLISLFWMCAAHGAWVLPALLLLLAVVCERVPLQKQPWKLVCYFGCSLIVLQMAVACQGHHAGAFAAALHLALTAAYCSSVAFDDIRLQEDPPYIYFGHADPGQPLELVKNLPVLSPSCHPNKLPPCNICHVSPRKGMLFLVQTPHCGHLYTTTA